MRFEQLKFLCAVVDHGFNICRAAETLHISQPAISKQVRALEQELRADLLIRVGGRIVGLTAAGHTVLGKARQVLLDVNELTNFGNGLADDTTGRLVIATTHSHARYALLDIVKAFKLSHPHVQLRLVQANPTQVVEAIIAGTADIGISSVDGAEGGELLKFRGGELGRSVIAPAGHSIFRESPLTLRQISKHPLITLDFSFPGGRAVGRAFTDAGIEPNIVMSATDADVIKAYVRLGLGIAILPTITFDRIVDVTLQAGEATHLFGTAPTFILIRPDTRIPAYLSDFIERVAPGQIRKTLRASVRHEARPRPPVAQTAHNE